VVSKESRVLGKRSFTNQIQERLCSVYLDTDQKKHPRLALIAEIYPELAAVVNFEPV